METVENGMSTHTQPREILKLNAQNLFVFSEIKHVHPIRVSVYDCIPTTYIYVHLIRYIQTHDIKNLHYFARAPHFTSKMMHLVRSAIQCT